MLGALIAEEDPAARMELVGGEAARLDHVQERLHFLQALLLLTGAPAPAHDSDSYGALIAIVRDMRLDPSSSRATFS